MNLLNCIGEKCSYFNKTCTLDKSKNGICEIEKEISKARTLLLELELCKEKILKKNIEEKGKIKTKEEAEENILKYLEYGSYDYSVKDLIRAYKKIQNHEYVSYTAKECIKNNEEELKFLTEKSL